MNLNLKRLVKNIITDIKYSGKFLGGNVRSKYWDSGSYNTVNSDYSMLDRILTKWIEPDDIIIDVGCGKGRVIAWCKSKKLPNPIIGVELDPEIASETQSRFKKYDNIKIIAGSILDKFPANGSLYYLFNPFNEAIMQKFIEVMLSEMDADRPAKIVYHNCLHLDLFRDNERFNILEVIEHPDTEHKTAVIIVNG